MSQSVKCPICDADLTLDSDTIQGELVECSDCGTELEVTSIQPFRVQEAPQEEEDWGQ
ncbi:lysine biosynthesis protein LysW [bacterium]|nr:lysine biosynthesis protein LysW [bacterium]